MSEERRRFGPPEDEAPVSTTLGWSSDDDAPASDPAMLDWSDETPVDVVAEEDDEPQIGLLAGLLGLKRRERLAARLRKLDRAIEAAPDAPVNYVLRGELRLKLGQRDEAAVDFQRALALAESAFTASDWGVIAQTMSDRALAGLRRAGYRLRPIER